MANSGHDVILILQRDEQAPLVGEEVQTVLCSGKVIWREKTSTGWRVGVKLPNDFVPDGSLD